MNLSFTSKLIQFAKCIKKFKLCPTRPPSPELIEDLNPEPEPNPLNNQNPIEQPNLFVIEQPFRVFTVCHQDSNYILEKTPFPFGIEKFTYKLTISITYFPESLVTHQFKKDFADDTVTDLLLSIWEYSKDKFAFNFETKEAKLFYFIRFILTKTKRNLIKTWIKKESSPFLLPFSSLIHKEYII